MRDRLNYWRRIFKVYLTKTQSYLTFWHEEPAVNDQFKKDELGEYYMTFFDKAKYAGPKDSDGVILFDYYGSIGRQYNPVAISQYGLGNFNLYLRNRSQENLIIAKQQGDWLVKNLETNEKGVKVWLHHFEWTYKERLKNPWYSALSQGNGISLLTRLYQETKDEKYLNAAKEAFKAMLIEIKDGGVKFVDDAGDIWIEEYIMDRPTHVLNGFIWALWGVWDYYLITKDSAALSLFQTCLKTMIKNLPRYDAGFWSLYDLSKQAMKMVASDFYHRLHIVELKIMHRLTGEPIFDIYAKKFQGYYGNKFKKKFALIYKAVFKIFYF